MGLGLNGGGLACARFLAERGALVTVTDTKDEAALAQSMAALEGLGIRYVLGRHEMADFEGADLVVKNPAVRPDSPYLKAAKAVETDLSLFLRLSSSPLIAVTGSKGKSTVSTAIYRASSAGAAGPSSAATSRSRPWASSTRPAPRPPSSSSSPPGSSPTCAAWACSGRRSPSSRASCPTT